jgi:hydroxymethylbilane synthase
VKPLRLGTRGSRLALIQSGLVAARLREQGAEVELVTVVTDGDTRQADAEIGEGIFVTALENELAAGRVDIAVHSAKDVPLKERAGLVVAAFPERADPRDALVTASGGATLTFPPPSHPTKSAPRRRDLVGTPGSRGRAGVGGDGPTLTPLWRGATIGTDSPRRAGFARHARPDASVHPMRGNVDTRLRRLDEGAVDALVLAAAGLDRLGVGGRIDERIDPEVMAPAPGQGALAVQCRATDAEVLDLVARIDDRAVRLAVTAERLVLQATGGTCRSPVGALGTVEGGRLRLMAAAASPDGREQHLLTLEAEATEEAARLLALKAGIQLLKKVVSLVGGIA